MSCRSLGGLSLLPLLPLLPLSPAKVMLQWLTWTKVNPVKGEGPLLSLHHRHPIEFVEVLVFCDIMGENELFNFFPFSHWSLLTIKSCPRSPYVWNEKKMDTNIKKQSKLWRYHPECIRATNTKCCLHYTLADSLGTFSTQRGFLAFCSHVLWVCSIAAHGTCFSEIWWHIHQS